LLGTDMSIKSGVVKIVNRERGVVLKAYR
jgi:hypothetical protein